MNRRDKRCQLLLQLLGIRCKKTGTMREVGAAGVGGKTEVAKVDDGSLLKKLLIPLRKARKSLIYFLQTPQKVGQAMNFPCSQSS